MLGHWHAAGSFTPLVNVRLSNLAPSCTALWPLIVSADIKATHKPVLAEPGGSKPAVTVTLERCDDSLQLQLQPAGRRSFARLVVGCPATDMLLLCESLILEEFSSPLTKQLSLTVPRGAWQVAAGCSRCSDVVLGASGARDSPAVQLAPTSCEGLTSTWAPAQSCSTIAA